MKKLSDQITVRLSPEMRAAIHEIEARHRISAAEFVRGLVEAGIDMYRTQGFFSFPVEVVPDKRPLKSGGAR
jgi:predicted DNA-binding protein